MKEATNLYLLQQPPFRFVDSLLVSTEVEVESLFEIRPNTVFVQNELLQIAGIMENIAQTCAAGIGEQIAKQGGLPHIAPLCAINKMHVDCFPKIGQMLHTKVRLVEKDFGVMMFDAEVFVEDKRIAVARIKTGM